MPRKDDLIAFLEMVASNQKANVARFPDAYDLIRRVNICLSTAGQNLVNAQPVTAGILCLRCQYAYKTAAGMALSGQVCEAFVMMRLTIKTCSEQSKIMDCAERMTKRTNRPECQSRDHRIPRSHRSAGLAGKATSSPLQHCRALLCRPSKRPAPRLCGRPAKLLTGPWWNRPPLQAAPSGETLLGGA